MAKGKKISSLEIAKSVTERNEHFFKNADRYLKLIYRASREELPDAKVYLFGSFYRGDYHPYLSDIDVAVVSEKLPERPSEISILKNKILRRAGIEGYSPFQLHLLFPSEWEFYRKFVKEEFREIKEESGNGKVQGQ
jgi:predicted nucleotidyltransferase